MRKRIAELEGGLEQFQAAEAKLRYLTSHDGLTGLANRELLEEHLNTAIQSSSAIGSQLAVLVINTDRFRSVNLHLGHQTGDRMLVYLAKRLQAYAPPSCTISRFGSDEFIIVLPEADGMAEVMAFAQGIAELFREPFTYGHIQLFVAASIGISICPNDGNDTDSLLNRAGIAMLHAKEKGGGLVQFYHPEMADPTKHDFYLEAQLRQALERQEFVLHYQPLVDLETSSVSGVEALIRWERPNGGLVPPGNFIPAAEHSGLIVPIGEWVLREACRQYRLWKNKGFGFLRMSVNISVTQLLHPGFVGQVRKALKEADMDPRNLNLEITENIALYNTPYILETINRLKGLGVQLAIDDFGTGYTSLGFLKQVQIHLLKIDKSFIDDVAVNEDSAAILTALLHMSRRLNIKTLAEGVETAEQLSFLKKEGCNYIQGYYFSPPLPVESVEQILEEKKCVE